MMIFYATTNIQEPVKLDFWHGEKTRFGRFFWCAKLIVFWLYFQNTSAFCFQLKKQHFLYGLWWFSLDKMTTFHQLLCFDVEIAYGRGRRLLKGQTLNFLKIFMLVNTRSTYMCRRTHNTPVWNVMVLLYFGTFGFWR